jgi:hypothetical protein
MNYASTSSENIESDILHHDASCFRLFFSAEVPFPPKSENHDSERKLLDGGWRVS